MRIKDAVGEIMLKVQTKWQAQQPEAKAGEPYYMYGRPQKIAALLSEKDEDKEWKYKKYPLVILFQEFTETRGGELFDSVADVTLAFVAQADPQNRTLNRDDSNFVNVLYPIYDLFFEELQASALFDTLTGAEALSHDLTESPYWGTEGQYGNTANIMNDTLDALFVENLNLRLNKSC